MNNNIFNNGFNNNGGFQGGGFQNGMMPGQHYAQRQNVKMTQPLTAEDVKKLRNKGSGFSLHVDDEDLMRAKCTHKDPTRNNEFTLRENPDNTVYCNICGETFNLIDLDESGVHEASSLILDILQTVKTKYIDIGENVASEYFAIIPLIKKLPQLYKISIDRFNQYDRGAGVQQNSGMYGFNMLQALTNPHMGQPVNNNFYNQNQGGYDQNGNPFGQQQWNNQQQQQWNNQQQQQWNNQQQGQYQGQPQQQGQYQGQPQQQAAAQPAPIVVTKAFNN